MAASDSHDTAVRLSQQLRRCGRSDLASDLDRCFAASEENRRAVVAVCLLRAAVEEAEQNRQYDLAASISQIAHDIETAYR